MTTIISNPTPSTTIISSLVGPPGPQGPAGDPAVDSVFGRIGDIVALDDDYDITQINPSGANDGDLITIESGRFIIEAPEIGNEVVQTASIVNGDILQFNGTNWINIPLDIPGPIAIHAALTDGVHGLIDTGSGTLFHSDDGTYKALTHPPDLVTSVFGRVGVVVAAVGDYAIADITGLTTVGPPTDFLGADGIYKAIVHPPDAVTSVFGRTGVVIALNGDYDITDITGLTTTGPGTNFLADDGVYKTSAAPVDSVFGRTGTVVAANNDYALAEIDGLIDSGGGSNFLADDGTYKTPAGGGTTTRQIVSPTLADATTIVDSAAHTTIFDFSPDTLYRNNNCLITIHYQAHNIPGNAQAATWLRTNIGLTVQQNAYHGTVAMDSNGDERLSFTIAMEGIVSATGNIEIEVRADGNSHDFSNSAANGKTRLTIELV